MTLIISAIILIALLLQYPGILFISLGIGICIYIYCSKPDLFAKLGLYVEMATTPKDKDDDLPDGVPDFETAEQQASRVDKELDKRMKPGYKDDPKWKEPDQRIHEAMRKNRKAADIEMHLEIMREAVEYAEAGKWSEVTRIEKELQDLEAKS